MKPIVLIVDDEASNVEYLVNIFNEKYDLKVAYDGAQALKILQSIHVDLILLDINMPNMDGFEVAKSIKKDDKLKELPFIYLTSSDDENTIIKGFEYGAVDYITKPFNKKELEVRVENHIKTHFLQSKLQNSLKQIKSQQSMLIQQSKFVAMGEMTAMLAHQWRQPLNAVSILIQEAVLKFTLSRLEEEEFEKISEKIKGQLEYMSQTIDDFRSFLKPNRQKTQFNIKQTLKSSFNISQSKLDHNYIKKDITYKSKKCLNLYGYESEIKQVFVNLVNNSIDAIVENTTEDEERLISVVVDCTEENIIIDFKDTGKGIKKELYDKLFEPYISTKSQLNGSGLGLYMSKLIIEKNMDGKISAFNTDKGACFRIYFNYKKN